VRVLGRPCPVSDVRPLVAGLAHPVARQLANLVPAGDLVAGRVAVPGDLHQELAPDRSNILSTLPLTGARATFALRFRSLGGQVAGLAAWQARRASSAP
jgi:hypothetical protein